MPPHGYISLHFYTPCILTPEEYEAIQRQVLAAEALDDVTPGIRVLAALLDQNAHHSLDLRAPP